MEDKTQMLYAFSKQSDLTQHAILHTESGQVATEVLKFDSTVTVGPARSHTLRRMHQRLTPATGMYRKGPKIPNRLRIHR